MKPPNLSDLNPLRILRKQLRLEHDQFLVPGERPGTFRAHKQLPKATLTLTGFKGGKATHLECKNANAIQLGLLDFDMIWLNVDGLGSTKTIKEVQKIFEFHDLAMEDVFDLGQRPKVEYFDNYHLVIARHFTLLGDSLSEQQSIFVGKNYVVTFNARDSEHLSPIHKRIEQGIGNLIKGDPDYLCFAIMDICADSFFPRLESNRDTIAMLEERAFGVEDLKFPQRVQEIRALLFSLLRVANAFQETLNELLAGHGQPMKKSVKPFYKDCLDHVLQARDLIQGQMQLTGDLLSVFHSNMSLRMNQIMKVLTMISTIFIPLSFIAGIYGMNFNTQRSPWNMPELNHPYGYLVVIGSMLSLVIVMFFFFIRKGWIHLPGRSQKW